MRKKGAHLGIIPAGPGKEVQVRCQSPPQACGRGVGPRGLGMWSISCTLWPVQWEVALVLISKVSGTVRVCSASNRTDLDLRSISGDHRVRTLRNPRVDPLCLSCLEPQSQPWPCCSQA